MRPLILCFALATTAVVIAQQAPQPAGADDPRSAPRISLAEFKKLHDAGQVVVLDVRSVEAYREGHIPGAISMPLTTIADRVAELKNVKQPIVTYCT